MSQTRPDTPHSPIRPNHLPTFPHPGTPSSYHPTTHRPPPRLAGVFLIFASSADRRPSVSGSLEAGIPVGNQREMRKVGKPEQQRERDRFCALLCFLSGFLLHSPLNARNLRIRKACHRSSGKTKENGCSGNSNSNNEPHFGKVVCQQL